MGGIISEPGLTINIIPATQEVENTLQKILFVGQKLASGSALPGALVQNILNDSSEDALFGQKSMLASMIRNAKKQNQINQMDAIPLADNPNIAATRTFFDLWVSGAATENGSLTFNITSKTNHSYTVDVTFGQDQEDVINALAAQVDADPDIPINSFGGFGLSFGLFGGPDVDDTLATWQAITDGSFRMTVDAVTEDFTGLNFSAVTTMEDVAIVIENAFSASLSPEFSGSSVLFDVGSRLFQFFMDGSSSGQVSYTSDVSPAVGTPISALMKTDAAQGTFNSPFTAFEFECSQAGTWGNDFALSVEGNVRGLTPVVQNYEDGSLDPDLANVFDVIGDRRYQTIVWPYPDTLGELQSLLDPRFNADNAILDGIGITAKPDTLANTLAYLTPLNDQNLTVITDKKEVDPPSTPSFYGSSQLEISAVKSSEFGAIRALRLTDGASIARFVNANNGPLDSFGGPALASKPYFNTPTPDLPLIGTGKGWGENEIEQLHDAGGSVFGKNTAGNVAIMGEIVTTYLNDSAGNPDVSFKYMNYVDTASNAREYFFNNLKARFAQSRLTEGDVLRGRDMVNALTIINYCEKLYQDLTGPDFVLLQAGEKARDLFRANISVDLDLAAGRATVQMVTPLVTQLREILVAMKIAFSTEG